MKILVIQMKMIGDVLTSSILFEALRKKFQNAELHYLVYEHTTPVLENNPYIDKLILFKTDRDKSVKGLQKLTQRIRKENYDAVIDVYSKINSSIINKGSNAPVRVSYRKWYTKFLYTHTFSYKEQAETEAGLAIENRMQLLQPLGNFPKELKPKLYLTKEERAQAKQRLISEGIDFNKPLYMIAILGSGEEKTYPKEYMAEVLDTIIKNTDAQLLLNYIPKQKTTVLEVLKLCKTSTREKIKIDVFGKSLREFMALTSFCDALIGNEGGAVNMAKALDIPTFSIFAPQTPRKDWAIYDNMLQNSSAHIGDYHPERIEGKSKKELRAVSGKLYQDFRPEFFRDKLIKFLRRINS